MILLKIHSSSKNFHLFHYSSLFSSTLGQTNRYMLSAGLTSMPCAQTALLITGWMEYASFLSMDNVVIQPQIENELIATVLYS